MEFLVIITLGFGIFIYSSTKNAFGNGNFLEITQTYTTYDFFFIVIYDLFALGLIWFILKLRKWKLTHFNLHFNYKMPFEGFLLAFLRISLGWAIIKMLETWSFLSQQSNPKIVIEASHFSILLIIIVNSFFEEFLLIGYIYKKLENLQPIVIIIVSFIVRASFHTYQGWPKLFSLLMMSILFGLYYIRYKNLWPIIMAHAIGNTYYFMNLE